MKVVFIMLNLEDIIDNKNLYYAHKKDGYKEEKLEEHQQLSLKYFDKLIKAKNLEKIIDNFFSGFFCNKDNKDLFNDLIKEAIYFHDIGKINTSFQTKKMNNKNFKNKSTYTDHSLISSLLFLDIQINKANNIKEDKNIYILLAFIFSYMISRHHGYLQGLEKFFGKLNNINEMINENKIDIRDYKYKDRLRSYSFENINNQIYKFLKKYKEKSMEFYIISKFIYALIVECDFYATSEYMSGTKIDGFGTINNIDNFARGFYDSKIVKNIYKYKDYLDNKGSSPFVDGSINNLRSKMFVESEKNIIKNKDKNIFYLEAPTGSGKTLNSINLALKMIENNSDLNKVFYVFPFNTLVDQTATVLEGFFDQKNIAKINSITKIKQNNKKNKDESEFESEETSYLNRLFLHYKVILTSHVQFFNCLTKTSRESHLPFSHLANSVVILDEIQSYKNLIWKEIIEIIKAYSRILNIKFIIMSATLPKLTDLTKNNNDNTICDLIDDRFVYFNNPLFKNRVSYDFSLLENKIDKEKLLQKVLEHKDKRVLVEFINKIEARKFYNLLKEKDMNNVYELSGDDNALYRRNIISKLKKKDKNNHEFMYKNIILIATQVIEAGVDIDMDIGFKDCSLIDSEEQFVGRINRSCSRQNCKVYFFDYYDETKIYKNDIRINFSLKDKKIREYFINKDFGTYFNEVLKKLEIEKQKANKNSFEIFKESLINLNYSKVEKILKLIDQNDFSLFINFRIYDNENKVYIEGKDVFDEYRNIINNKNMPYAKKQIKLSELSQKMSYFIFNVKALIDYDCEIGGIYYIDDKKDFILDGKFNRDKYNEYTKGYKMEEVLFI
ncbi:MAG: CRISPR-associated helicase Cas3' [Peptostreptococcaceae bacterium]|jgi:CRISPR-associated endonuclease/helicase Cas3|nr:CRISPR-associated helicase Cas3' [Peptostreptococcaceae bacterium]